MMESRDATVAHVAAALRVGLEQTLQHLVSWFFHSMPAFYFHFTPADEQVRHLQAILMGRVFETRQSVLVRSGDGRVMTFIGPADNEATLLEMLRQTRRLDISSAEIYTSKDNLLMLGVFNLQGAKPVELEAEGVATKIQASIEQLLERYPLSEEDVEAYFTNLTNDYVLRSSVERIVRHASIFFGTFGREEAYISLDSDVYPDCDRLDVAVSHVHAANYMQQLVTVLQRFGLSTVRGFQNILADGRHEPISMMTLYIVDSRTRERPDHDNLKWLSIQKAIQTLKWVEEDELTGLMDTHGLTINEANFLRAATEYVHIFLSKINLYYYSQDRIKQTILRHADLSVQLVRLFKARFDLREQGDRERKVQEARERSLKLIEGVSDKVEYRIMSEILRFVTSILKTNYFILNKTGLAFRMSPAELDPRYYPQKPFGFFFFYGKNYRGFHVRWKDMARGGLRIVLPRSREYFEKECDRLFDEVMNLSLAQQLKNKDIPEGGAKGVLLLTPGGSAEVAVRGAVDSLLDLIVLGADGKLAQNVVDYYGREEIIYLGPDENVTNEMINWIVDHAKARGYRYPYAFMSSKPGIGINHKEFGVTSEGINVYLENCLSYLGINPRTTDFTVKMTGGPDGDVAGNAIKILLREYRQHARIVAIADGFGCGADPAGLDQAELLRLVREGRSIVEFDPAGLSKAPGAFVRRADDDEGVAMRNGLHNTASADVFIPAGGRPATINGDNWEKFLDAQGRPSARIIVEGANIFLTEDARLKLEDRGVVIIKDSSANKAGVICSSYEIIASLILSVEEFAAIRDNYIREVLAILRQKADLEANLLFREYDTRNKRTPLSKLSLEVSREINDLSAIIEEALNAGIRDDDDQELYADLLLAYCPRSLSRNYADRITREIPLRHRTALLAAHIASSIVYREGLGWISSLSPDNSLVFKVVQTYLQQNKVAEQYIAEVLSSNLAGKEEIAAILNLAARKELVRMALRRRQVPFANLRAEVKVNGAKQPAEVKRIDTDGAHFVGQFGLHVGEAFSAALKITGDAKALNLHCEVVKVENNGEQGVVARFVEISPRAQKALGNLLASAAAAE
ncbi:MAG: NAD-glutamate dehydrogenase [Candidatus Sericytochromatia bacterium]|nr:NAD-glutamate dehydrogenase [Candidatus Tanganyikabacteria bacterium]